MKRILFSMTLLASTGSIALTTGCKPGAAGKGTLIVTVAPEISEPIDNGSGDTIELSGAWLHLHALEIFRDEEDGHHHAMGQTAHDAEHAELAVTAGPALIDLLGDEVVLLEKSDAPAGEYHEVRVDLAPAITGDQAGYTLWIDGTAERGSESLDFSVRWQQSVPGFAELEADVHLKHRATEEAALAIDVNKLFNGIDLFDADLDDGVVRVDEENNDAILTQILSNLAEALSIESHDH